MDKEFIVTKLSRMADKYREIFDLPDDTLELVNQKYDAMRRFDVYAEAVIKEMFGEASRRYHDFRCLSRGWARYADLTDAQRDFRAQIQDKITLLETWLELLEDELKGTRVISILFLAADPTDASRLRLSEEFREIHEKLKLAQLRDHFKLELPQLSVRPADISQALLDVQPKIVHFSGHGAFSGALCFENQLGQTHFVHPDALAALFEQFAHQVNCVLLNACYSKTQAEAVAKHIKYVIGMNQAIGDKAAIAFAIGFYQALGAGRTIEDAYKLGYVQIRLQGIPEHLVPVLIKSEEVWS